MHTHTERLRQFKQLLQSMEQDASSIECWHNLRRAPQAFDLLANQLPMRMEGALTPYVRVLLTSRLLEATEVLSLPRLALQMLHYLSSLLDAIDSVADRPTDMAYDGYEGNPSLYVRSLQCVKEVMRSEERRLQDFINPDVPLATWCKRYADGCLFDPLERTFEWELHIAEVEELTHRSLPPDGSAFRPCNGYWERKAEVVRKLLHKEWKSPSEMNPTLIFD